MRRKIWSGGLFAVSLVLLCLPVKLAAGYSATERTNTSVIGTVTCYSCRTDNSPHKGYTKWTWALHRVNEGDGIVLIVGNEIFGIEGDTNELLKYMEDKVEVTGRFQRGILFVETIKRPASKKK